MKIKQKTFNIMKTLIDKIYNYARIHGTASLLIYPTVIIVLIMVSL